MPTPKVIYEEKIEEVSVLNKDKRSMSAYLKNGWIVTHEGKHGKTLRKVTSKGSK
jgi:hypothetical protein